MNYAEMSHEELLQHKLQIDEALKGKEVEALEARVAALGYKLVKEANGRKPARIKYRSLKDPSLTSTGQGRLAGWLKAEMEESGRPIEDFLIGE